MRVAVNRDGGHLALAGQKDTVAVGGQTRRWYDCRGTTTRRKATGCHESVMEDDTG